MKESLSEKIRKYCNETKIIPARTNGKKIIKIRAGDIVKEMNLRNRTPAVCGCLQTLIFENLASVKRISTDGPCNGENCVITFQIL